MRLKGQSIAQLKNNSRSEEAFGRPAPTKIQRPKLREIIVGSLAFLVGCHVSGAVSAPIAGAENGRPEVVGAPLQAQQVADDSCRNPSVWRGPPPMNLNEGWRWETEQIEKLDGRAKLFPVGAFDPAKTPVIFVGGGEPDHKYLLEPVRFLTQDGTAQDGTKRPSMQAFYYVYDRDQPLDEMGRELASTIEELRTQHYGPSTDLNFVSQSTGGLVVVAALNELENPDWLQEDGEAIEFKTPPNPRGGFQSINLRSYDVPAGGVANDMKRAALWTLYPIVKPFIDDYGLQRADEMLKSVYAEGPIMSRLLDRPLPGVSIKNYSPTESMDISYVPVGFQTLANGMWDTILKPIDDRSTGQLESIAASLLAISEADEPYQENLANLLRSDDRFPALIARLQELRKSQPDETLASNLRTALRDTMAPLKGTHADLPDQVEAVADLDSSVVSYCDQPPE